MKVESISSNMIGLQTWLKSAKNKEKVRLDHESRHEETTRKIRARTRTKTTRFRSPNTRSISIKNLSSIAIIYYLICAILMETFNNQFNHNNVISSSHSSSNNNNRYFASSSIIELVKAEEAPRITIQPNDLIAIEGESTELNCDADGEPEPTIEWFHNGQLIRQSSKTRTTMAGSIQFLDVRPATTAVSVNGPGNSGRPSDVGVYHCLAKNPFGQARSRNASLQVAYIREQFKLAPKDKYVSVGESSSFDCLPQAWPEPQIQWRFNGQPIELNGTRLPDGSHKYQVIKLAKTDIANTNMDRQQIVNSTPSQSSAWHTQQGSILTTKSPADKGNGNGKAIANSNFADQDHSSPWSSSQPVMIDLIGSRLQIRNIDKSDEGKYSCLVETRGSHRLIERESPQAQLLAFLKPYFIEAPKDTISQLGGQVRLRCRMGGDPEPVISWRKQNGQPLSEKTQIDANDKTLVLEQVSVADQGGYICEGENSAGSARATANVAVQSRPKFTVQPEDQEVDPGSHVKLRCSGDASPAPMLFWYKEGHRQLMFAPDTNHHLPRQYLLPQPQQQPLSGDSDSWVNQPQTAALVSRPPSTSTNSQSSTIQMPTFSDTSPAINKLFTLPLNQQSTDLLSTTGSFFTNRVQVDNQGTLNIVNVTLSDSGYYACALISPVGSVLAKARLIVRQTSPLGPMESPYQSSTLLDNRFGQISSGKFELLPPPVIKLGAANQTLPMNTSATLNCEVVSQVPYKIQWYFDNQPLQEELSRVLVLDSGALQINNLRTSDSGIYTCVVTAASDQAMPIANPSEPFDSSMLTSAPPIQQVTSHSSMLKVASPMNPNIQFFRENIYAVPSAPGQATTVPNNNNGNDAITISWAAPAEAGNLPIKEYIIEHYDTSQEQLGWRVIYNIKGKESLLIDGLSSEGSHFFVIRAANSHGVGPSSAISGPMRTINGEALYQQELARRADPFKRVSLDSGLYTQANNLRPEATLARERLMSTTTNLLTLIPMNANSIRLQWSTQIVGNLSGGLDSNSNVFPISNLPDIHEFLEGYSIRYRAIGSPESFQPRDMFSNMNANVWTPKGSMMPTSLPLVTSYLDREDEPLIRERRQLTEYNDYSQEFNEIRVADHNTEHYTVNSLKPFTLYQFFVVPYYRDIDGIPSNLLTSQTHEDKPSIAPPNLTVHAINNTAVRLLWLHIPQTYANGILKGYILQLNKSDIVDGQQKDLSTVNSHPSTRNDLPKMINLPISTLTIVPYSSLNPDVRTQTYMNSIHQYVVMFELTNLNYKSFFSIQVAGYTNSGPGPFSDVQNFIMDPAVLAQSRIAINEIDDVMSKTMISNGPQAYSSGFNYYNIGITVAAIFIVSTILLVIFILYRRDRDRVVTWKKTISEHFNSKFYVPTNTEPMGTNSLQQNIYDHNQHLIYSRTNQINHPSIGSQQLWANNGRMSSGGTVSTSSHGAILPMNGDPNSQMCRIIGGEQVMLMNTKEINPAFVKNQPAQIVNQMVDPGRHQESMMNQGDYYSVINNMAEYEELESHHQRNNIQTMNNGDRHQTASSNSDTSCPNSVTRLLPNQNYNRELLTKKFNENLRQDQILHHPTNSQTSQMSANCYGKPLFATIGNGLSPYATTNLIPQQQQQHAQQQQVVGYQMTLIDPSRQHQSIHSLHNNTHMRTMED